MAWQELRKDPVTGEWTYRDLTPDECVELAGIIEVAEMAAAVFELTRSDAAVPIVEPLPVRCEWYLMCDQFTHRAVRHPLLGAVPCCARCEAKHVEVGGNPGFVIGLEDDDA